MNVTRDRIRTDWQLPEIGSIPPLSVAIGRRLCGTRGSSSGSRRREILLEMSDRGASRNLQPNGERCDSHASEIWLGLSLAVLFPLVLIHGAAETRDDLYGYTRWAQILPSTNSWK
jgi:hypothetical protein